MGAAALRKTEGLTARGSTPRGALELMLGPIVFDCLRASVPQVEYDGRQSYLVNRSVCVMDALDGGGWSLLTMREEDVALCVRSLLRDPYAWDADEWDRKIASVVESYRQAAGIS